MVADFILAIGAPAQRSNGNAFWQIKIQRFGYSTRCTRTESSG